MEDEIAEVRSRLRELIAELDNCDTHEHYWELIAEIRDVKAELESLTDV